jgi:TfuA protein
MQIERNMKTIILLGGPSVPRGTLEGVEVRQPARRGDFLKLAGDSGSLVVFADGCFFSEPAPTHNELLHYLKLQRVLIGTASMGALRATELSAFGLVGIGTVFDAFRTGLVRDDAEVAVAMCPFTFSALTIPLVNVRRLLYLLAREGLPEPTLLQAWISAKNIYFMERTLRRLRMQWQLDGVDLCSNLLFESASIRDFDLKKQDVLHALDYAREVLRTGTLQPRLETEEFGLYTPPQ